MPSVLLVSVSSPTPVRVLWTTTEGNNEPQPNFRGGDRCGHRSPPAARAWVARVGVRGVPRARDDEPPATLRPPRVAAHRVSRRSSRRWLSRGPSRRGRGDRGDQGSPSGLGDPPSTNADVLEALGSSRRADPELPHAPNEGRHSPPRPRTTPVAPEQTTANHRGEVDLLSVAVCGPVRFSNSSSIQCAHASARREIEPQRATEGRRGGALGTRIQRPQRARRRSPRAPNNPLSVALRGPLRFINSPSIQCAHASARRAIEPQRAAKGRRVGALGTRTQRPQRARRQSPRATNGPFSVALCGPLRFINSPSIQCAHASARRAIEPQRAAKGRRVGALGTRPRRPQHARRQSPRATNVLSSVALGGPLRFINSPSIQCAHASARRAIEPQRAAKGRRVGALGTRTQRPQRARRQSPRATNGPFSVALCGPLRFINSPSIQCAHASARRAIEPQRAAKGRRVGALGTRTQRPQRARRQSPRAPNNPLSVALRGPLRFINSPSIQCARTRTQRPQRARRQSPRAPNNPLSVALGGPLRFINSPSIQCARTRPQRPQRARRRSPRAPNNPLSVALGGPLRFINSPSIECTRTRPQRPQRARRRSPRAPNNPLSVALGGPLRFINSPSIQCARTRPQRPQRARRRTPRAPNNPLSVALGGPLRFINSPSIQCARTRTQRPQRARRQSPRAPNNPLSVALRGPLRFINSPSIQCAHASARRAIEPQRAAKGRRVGALGTRTQRPQHARRQSPRAPKKPSSAVLGASLRFINSPSIECTRTRPQRPQRARRRSPRAPNNPLSVALRGPLRFINSPSIQCARTRPQRPQRARRRSPRAPNNPLSVALRGPLRFINSPSIQCARTRPQRPQRARRQSPRAPNNPLSVALGGPLRFINSPSIQCAHASARRAIEPQRAAKGRRVGALGTRTQRPQRARRQSPRATNVLFSVALGGPLRFINSPSIQCAHASARRAIEPQRAAKGRRVGALGTRTQRPQRARRQSPRATNVLFSVALGGPLRFINSPSIQCAHASARRAIEPQRAAKGRRVGALGTRTQRPQRARRQSPRAPKKPSSAVLGASLRFMKSHRASSASNEETRGRFDER